MHLGTLLLGPPTNFSGGELALYHGEEAAKIDWSTTGRNGDQSFRWLFFYSDVEHEILPVVSGHRVTIAYDVYRAPDVSYEVPTGFVALDIKENPLYKALGEGLRNPNLFPEGARLAFGLSHQYSATKMESNKLKMNAILKG